MEAIMDTKKIIVSSIFGLISMFIFTFAWASGSGQSIVLEPTRQHPDANATAFIDASHASIQARGLKPNAVYAVWIVNRMPKKSETGAGAAPFILR